MESIEEERTKRYSACGGVIGKTHAYRYRGPAGFVPWRECGSCGVTETDKDYERKMLRTEE